MKTRLIRRIVASFGGHRFVWFAVLASLILIIELLPSRSESEHPEDKVLIQNFEANRQYFDRLRVMAQKEASIFAVTNDVTVPEHLTDAEDARVQTYRMVLNAVCPDGELRISKAEQALSLTCTSVGVVTHNSQKGYLYSEEPPKSFDLYPNLDSFTKKGAGNGYRRIEGNWYLFYTGY